MRRILLVLALTFPFAAHAQRRVFAIGDVVAIAPAAPSGAGVFFNSPYPLVLDNEGQIVTSMRNLSASTAAFDAQGRLLIAIGTRITLMEDSNFVLGDIFVGQPFRDNVLTMAPAPNGELFVLTSSSDLLEISADTSSVKRIVLPDMGFPVAHANIDLGPDGCTLYYLNHNGEIARYDVCTGAALPKFLSNVTFASFRVLGDGGVVASTERTLEFYDSAARPFKTLALSGSPANSIAFDADPAYVWANVPLYLAKIRISDGRPVVVQPIVFDSIVVRGERRPTTIDITGIARRRGARH